MQNILTIYGIGWGGSSCKGVEEKRWVEGYGKEWVVSGGGRMSWVGREEVESRRNLRVDMQSEGCLVFETLSTHRVASSVILPQIGTYRFYM